MKLFLFLTYFLFSTICLNAQSDLSFSIDAINQNLAEQISRISHTDFNYDNLTDFIVCMEGRKILFIENFGNTTFEVVEVFDAKTFLGKCIFVDFNFDGQIDIVYESNDKIYLRKQICNYQFAEKEFLHEIEHSALSFKLNDINFDNKYELILTEKDDNGYGYYQIYFLSEANKYEENPYLNIKFVSDPIYQNKFYLSDFTKDNFKDLVEYHDFIADQKVSKIHALNDSGINRTITLDSLQSENYFTAMNLPSISSIQFPNSISKNLYFGMDNLLYNYSILPDLSFTLKVDTFSSEMNFNTISLKDINNDVVVDLKSTDFYIPNIQLNSTNQTIPLPVIGNYENFNNNSAIDALVINEFSTTFDLYLDFNGLIFSDTVQFNLNRDEKLKMDFYNSAKIDNDNFNDIYGFTSKYKIINILKNDGAGNFTTFNSIHLNQIEKFMSIDHADFNNDQLTDFVSVGSFINLSGVLENKIFVLLNNGNETYETYDLLSYPFDESSIIKTADVDLDNDIDIIVLQKQNEQIVIFENKGFGEFSVKDALTVRCDDLILADFNNNGAIDILTNFTDDSDQFFIYLNDGFGNFTSNYSYQNVTAKKTLRIYDVNKDGYLDIIVFDKNADYKLSYYKNDRHANFIFEQYFEGSKSLTDKFSTIHFAEFEAADINNDGHLDILALHQSNVLKPHIYFGDVNLSLTPIPINAYINQEEDAIFHFAKFHLNDFNNDNAIDFISKDVLWRTFHVVKNNLYDSYVPIEESNEFYFNCHNFNLDEVYESVAIKIFNLNGQVIKNDILYNTDNVNYQFYAPKGLYILKAMSNTGKQFSFKLSK